MERRLAIVVGGPEDLLTARVDRDVLVRYAGFPHCLPRHRIERRSRTNPRIYDAADAGRPARVIDPPLQDDPLGRGLDDRALHADLLFEVEAFRQGHGASSLDGEAFFLRHILVPVPGLVAFVGPAHRQDHRSGLLGLELRPLGAAHVLGVARDVARRIVATQIGERELDLLDVAAVGGGVVGRQPREGVPVLAVGVVDQRAIALDAHDVAGLAMADGSCRA